MRTLVAHQTQICCSWQQQWRFPLHCYRFPLLPLPPLNFPSPGRGRDPCLGTERATHLVGSDCHAHLIADAQEEETTLCAINGDLADELVKALSIKLLTYRADAGFACLEDKHIASSISRGFSIMKGIWRFAFTAQEGSRRALIGPEARYIFRDNRHIDSGWK